MVTFCNQISFGHTPNSVKHCPDSSDSMKHFMEQVTAIRSRISEGVVLGTVVPEMHTIGGEVVIVTYTGRSMPGKSVLVQLISHSQIDRDSGRGKLSEKVSLERRTSVEDEGIKTTSYCMRIKVEKLFGIPGAFIIANKHKHRFFLQHAEFKLPSGQTMHFDCNSWVYPIRKTKKDRIFFANSCYLPNQTPAALLPWRREELCSLRGDGTGERKEWERVYDYDCYDDLCTPKQADRYILGGSESHPYPRRIRTGRSAKTAAESRATQSNLNVFVPPDDQIHPKRLLELQAKAKTIPAVALCLEHEMKFSLKEGSGSFDSFQEMLEVFSANLAPPEEVMKNLPKEHHETILTARKHKTDKFPLPRILADNQLAWKDDYEFARQMLAGTNPAGVRRLREFPPRSRSGIRSSIRTEYIEHNLDGLTTRQAMRQRRVFILDHHDYLLPFLNRINTEEICAYASRTLLFLREDATLKPVAIELTSPGSSSEMEIHTVVFPVSQGTEAAMWQLAKTHVAANDCAYHQLITHWLHTHAVVEPFIIATRRQLSAMHPIHWLLRPHFRDTIHINELYRRFLVNSGGVLEKTLFTGEASMELSSMLYKEWRFNEQGLPADLLKRGMAVIDLQQPAGVSLIFEDYPYGKDGLDVWMAIRTWVRDFCLLFYNDDDSVESDEELQAWWSEIRNVGHGDKPNEGWYSMENVADLVQALTTLIWITSAHHAAINFGQYAYGSYPPNRPSLCRRYIPYEGTREFAEFLRDTDKFYMKMLPRRSEMTLWVALLEVLSQHSSEEVLLGQKSRLELSGNEEIQHLHEKFNRSLKEIGRKILQRNRNQALKNRCGIAKIPYELLYPGTSSEASGQRMTGKGIPSSISI